MKGYKPWEKPSPEDTRTNEQGGHTIWYNEQQLLKDIEKRLGSSVAQLAPDLSLPPQLAKRMAGTTGQRWVGVHCTFITGRIFMRMHERYGASVGSYL